MRNGFFGALAALAAGVASARAQTSSPYAQHLPAPTVAAAAEPVLLPAPPGRLPPTLPTTTGAEKSAAASPRVTCLPEPCTVCKPAPRLCGSLEYLAWYNRHEAVPPL